jgi:hypothetical protein
MSAPQPNLKLQALSALLRDPERWPASFGPWNYANWSTCACGLAVASGIATNWADDFGLTQHDFDFVFAVIAPGLSTHNTTPEIVAERIDAYLAYKTQARRERIAA